jgi:anti-sigma factor RsiW
MSAVFDIMTLRLSTLRLKEEAAMSDVPMPLPLPDDDSLPPPDPFEAELVAYLDGELDPVAAQKVEARLASDPAARAKAAELKKTFDLLDYLPRPEPSPTFATRTIDKLPAITAPQGTPSRSSSAARTQAEPQQKAVGGSQGVPTPGARSARSASSSAPLTLDDDTIPLPRQGAHRAGLWAAAILVAVGACGAIGYFSASLIHSHNSHSQTPVTDELAAVDRRVVEYLALYAPIDDFDYVRELASPELFGNELAVAYEWKLTPIDRDALSISAFEKHTQAFNAMPAVRQQAIRELDRQLHAQEPATRDRLIRVLEVHAVWLERLPETQRKVVFAASDSKKRLDEVRNIRNDQWVEALPAAQRTELHKLPAQQQADRILKWKEEETIRRDEWAFIRKHSDEIVSNKIPWPFDSIARQKEVSEFMRAAYHTDDDKKCRFNSFEQKLYKGALDATEKGGWLAWYGYGKVCYELVRKYELLPEPATGEPLTTYSQLGQYGNISRFFAKDSGPGHKWTALHVGKWPEFALAVHGYIVNMKAEKVYVPALGPAKPGEFKEPLKTFVIRDLKPVLKQHERDDLSNLEGRWPEYPRKLVSLARQHDISIPGMMLPGEPDRWDKTYGFPQGPRMPFGPRP